MANQTIELPRLPPYTLRPVQPLIPGISDFHLSLLLPVAAYWFMSLIFWYIDKKDYFSQYRLHTPEEFKQRNRVSAIEVLRSVLLQQTIQTALGLSIGYLTEPGDLYGREDYDIALWASKIHHAQSAIPWILAAVGLDTNTLGQKLHAFTTSINSPPRFASKPTTAATNLVLTALFEQDSTTGFAGWEVWVARTIYWVLEPAARFGIAVFFSDSWQYFWHRAMHSNKWMYRKIFLFPPSDTKFHTTLFTPRSPSSIPPPPSFPSTI